MLRVKEVRTMAENPMRMREINPDQTAGIIQTGRPAGLWYAKAESGWIGLEADGERCGVCVGSFPEVLTWLFSKNGIGGTDAPKDRNVSRDPVWTASGDTDPGIRIPGAVIGEWREPVTVIETTPRFVVNTERAAEIRAGLPQSAPLTAPTEIGLRPTPEREPKREPTKRGGRPAGSATGRTLGKQRRDERIARYVLDGMGDDEIAVRMGVTGSSARKYILTLRREGRFPNDKLPAWRVRDFQKGEACGRRHDPEKTRSVIALRRAGNTWSEIARRTGVSKSRVQEIYRRYRDKGEDEG